MQPMQRSVVYPFDVSVLESSLLLPIIFGGTLAGMAHTSKAATRLASTASTAGIANVGISIAEDVTVVVVLFVIIFLVVVPRLFRMLGRGLQRLRGGAVAAE